MQDNAQHLDLNLIEARANAATRGPWVWQANNKGYPQQIVGNDDGLTLVAETFIGPEHFPAEAEFIAHARTDVPALVATLRNAEAKLAAIRGCVPTLRNLPEMYRHLVMDTPKDQELHRRVTEVSDRAIDSVLAILDGK